MSDDTSRDGPSRNLPDILDESPDSLPELKHAEPLHPPQVVRQSDSDTDRTESFSESETSTHRSRQDRGNDKKEERTRGRAERKREREGRKREREQSSSDDKTAHEKAATDANESETSGEGRSDGDLPPQEVDRIFTLLEETVTADTLDSFHLNQLLSVLEQGVIHPTETDSETISELISMLEELLIEPDELDSLDVGGFLRIFEEALRETTGDDTENLADLFSLLEKGMQDPTAIDPEDIEQIRRNIEGAVTNIADPMGVVGGLFGTADAEEYTFDAGDGDEPIDMSQIARIAAALTQRATGYSMESGLRTGTRMAYAAANSKSPAELVTNARAITLDELQRAGIDIGDDQTSWLATYDRETIDPRPATREALVERGERLLEQSAEVGRNEDIHPAFPSILDNLSPDETRILRLLAMDGPQPALDVYDRSYLPWSLKSVATNLTMLGSDAGCRTPVRTAAYLQNLERLGLVEVVDEPIDQLKRYQVLEAQSHVEVARDSAKRQRTTYKTVRLTDFGIAFCEMCFPYSVSAIPQTAKFREESSE